MWQVVNRTPFAAERGWVRDRDGAEVWLVAVKATFDIKPDGSTEIAKEQAPVLRVPEYHGEPGKSSLKYEADLVLTKKTTDVLVVGHARAPKGYQTTGIDVGFRLGSITKVLRVFGDRHWKDEGGWSTANPFDKIPLVYERAFGGVDRRSEQPERDWDWRNPVGTGFAVSRANLAGVALPNVEYPNKTIQSWKDRPSPEGFGPIACHWQPRVAFAGTYDDAWMKSRQPLLPEDFDERFFQCAPVDQQTPDFLHGGEPVAMRGFLPDGDLRFHLPKLFFGFETRFYDGSSEIHKNKKLHTVILEPDFPRVSLVWHTALPCHFKTHKLQSTIISLKTDLSGGLASVNEAEEEFA